MVVNFVEVEDAHKRFPAEWQEKFSEVDWSETLFVCYEIDESLYDAYEITSEDEIFGRHENGEITRLTDFTSKLDLATGIILEEEDYELNLVGYFLKGDLVQLKFKDAKAVNRKDRIKAQEEFQETIDHVKKRVGIEEAKSKSIIYKIWKSLISVPLTAIRFVLGFFIKVCFFIEDLLT